MDPRCRLALAFPHDSSCANERYDDTTSTLVQALYAVADLAEVTNLFGMGIADEVILMDELHSMWASESDDPLTGCP